MKAITTIQPDHLNGQSHPDDNIDVLIEPSIPQDFNDTPQNCCNFRGSRNHSSIESRALYLSIIEDAMQQIGALKEREKLLMTSVEALFRSRNEFFNKVMSIYIDKKSSPKIKKTIVDDLERMFDNMKADLKIENVERQVNTHMGNILEELRKRCPSLSKDDIALIALSYAGYMPKFISELFGYSPRYFYVKRNRIIERLEKLLPEDSKRFTSRMK